MHDLVPKEGKSWLSLTTAIGTNIIMCRGTVVKTGSSFNLCPTTTYLSLVNVGVSGPVFNPACRYSTGTYRVSSSPLQVHGLLLVATYSTRIRPADVIDFEGPSMFQWIQVFMSKILFISNEIRLFRRRVHSKALRCFKGYRQVLWVEAQIIYSELNLTYTYSALPET
jgi:hypothetical protein